MVISISYIASQKQNHGVDTIILEMVWLTDIFRLKYQGCYPLLPKAYLMHKICEGMLICH